MRKILWTFCWSSSFLAQRSMRWLLHQHVGQAKLEFQQKHRPNWLHTVGRRVAWSCAWVPLTVAPSPTSQPALIGSELTPPRSKNEAMICLLAKDIVGGVGVQETEVAKSCCRPVPEPHISQPQNMPCVRVHSGKPDHISKLNGLVSTPPTTYITG